MIAETLSLTRWEWFKLRRRRLPWILLFVSVLLLQITFWSAYALFRVGDDGRWATAAPPASVEPSWNSWPFRTTR